MNNLEMEMNKTEMEMEMAEEIWQKLPENIMLKILARLPIKTVVRFRAVCKRWEEIFQSLEFKQLASSLMAYSSPAFVFVILDDEKEPFEQFVCMKWINVENGYKLQRLSLDFLPRPYSVMASCKGLICCCENSDEITYICNPLTRTWIKLPEGHELTWWDFIGLTFDSCTRCCILIRGRQEYNDILIEIYNSKINVWTQFQTSVDELVRPVGEGIYSDGKFYWLNGVDHDAENFAVVSFDLEDRQWNKIEGPNKITSDFIWDSQISGTGGLIALVYEYEREFCVWNLVTDEVEGTQWSSPITFGSEQEMGISMASTSKEFIMNESGYISVVSPLKGIIAICCQGKLLYKVNCWGQQDNPFDCHSSVTDVV